MNALLVFMRNHAGELALQASQHLLLTVAALGLAVAVGLPIGLSLSRNKRLSGLVLGIAGVLQTIPSLALLGFLIPFIGIGAPPAIVALFLYALLPIIRNTVVGVEGAPPAVREAAVGMGMTDFQVLRKVELPLAAPIIFAGIRTAAVVAVGVATLAALIGAGGLGVYIFRGISLADPTMILAGAIPAAALALALDALLGRVERRLDSLLVPAALFFLLVLGATIGHRVASGSSQPTFRIGMPAEFMERPDGYAGLARTYGIRASVVEMDHGLMYRALADRRVDAVVGYSTDGEIAAFGLRLLDDDRHYFPPYFAAPLVRKSVLAAHPEIRDALGKLAGRLNGLRMAELNARVEHGGEPAASVAEDFLHEEGLSVGLHRRSSNADVVVGSKIFGEQYLLAEMFADLIETYTGLSVRLDTGLGGTKICFEALRKGEIDVYPEYTGTGLYAILDATPSEREPLGSDATRVYQFVKQEFARRFELEWLAPLGFTNTYAVILRNDPKASTDLRTTSDLSRLLSSRLLSSK